MNEGIRVIFLFSFFFILGCERKESSKQNDKFNNGITLLNIEKLDRKGIARVIEMVNKCNPKVIAINIIFKEFNSTNSDSLLLTAIEDSKKVVLVSNIDEDRIINSDSTFLTKSIGQGVLLYGLLDGKVSSFKASVPWKDKTLWTFPMSIAIFSDLENSDNILKSTIVDTDYDIHLDLDGWNIISIDSSISKIDCAKLDGKIIILGDLGPNSSDKRLLTTTPDSVYSTLIVANIVNDFLNKALVVSE